MSRISITIAQSCSSLVSVVASTFMAIMIPRSGRKLTTPSRRIIFALSISEIIQSGSIFLSPFLTPNNWSNGSQLSCDAIGFFVFFGGFGTVAYILSLCLYFLLTIKNNMSDKEFAKKYERYLHPVTIITSFCSTAFLVAIGNVNPLPDGQMCALIENPVGCLMNDNIECKRGNSRYALILLGTVPVCIAFLCMVALLTSLYLSVRNQEKKRNNVFRSSFALPASKPQDQGRSSYSGRMASVHSRWSNTPGQSSAVGSSSRSCTVRESQKDRSYYRRLSFSKRPSALGSNQGMQSLDNRSLRYRTKGAKVAQRRTRETLQQAILYAAAFFGTYSLPLISTFIYRKNGNVSLPLAIAAHTILPLGGVANILVYTRTKVITVRRRKEEYSWRRAFWEVVKAGGEVPSHCKNKKKLGRASQSLHDKAPQRRRGSVLQPSTDHKRNSASISFRRPSYLDQSDMATKKMSLDADKIPLAESRSSQIQYDIVSTKGRIPEDDEASKESNSIDYNAMSVPTDEHCVDSGAQALTEKKLEAIDGLENNEQAQEFLNEEDLENIDRNNIEHRHEIHGHAQESLTEEELEAINRLAQDIEAGLR